MQSVREFYNDDSDILSHRHENLFEVFRLFFLLRFKLDFIEFRNALDEFENLFAELFLYVALRNGSIFDYVMQKSRGNGIIIHSEVDKDLRDSHGMSEILLAGRALLSFVGFLREQKRFFQNFAFACGIAAFFDAFNNFFVHNFRVLSPIFLAAGKCSLTAAQRRLYFLLCLISPTNLYRISFRRRQNICRLS